MKVAAALIALSLAHSGLGAQESRTISYSADVPVTIEQAWQYWTDPTAITEWFSPSIAVDVRPGGPYEIYFDPTAPMGGKGCEGCTVMAVNPPHLLSFSWNLPPAEATMELREQGQMTSVQIRFEELDDSLTRVTLINTGYGTGEAWDAGVEYFRQAWKFVMSWFRHRAEVGPIDWASPPMAFPDDWVTTQP